MEENQMDDVTMEDMIQDEEEQNVQEDLSL